MVALKNKVLANSSTDNAQIRYLCLNPFGDTIRNLSKYDILYMDASVNRVKDKKIHDIIDQFGKRNKSNIEKAKSFINKCRMLGIKVELNIYNENDIELVSVSNSCDVSTFEIPEFITSFKKFGTDMLTYSEHERKSPFFKSSFEHIIISAKLSILDGLLSGIDSDKLIIEFKHPETILCLWIKELKKLN